MRFTQIIWTTAVLLTLVLIVSPCPVSGCAVSTSADGTVTISSESAVIIYDAATKTEHFIRTANFQSSSTNFGFMVPTPTKPELTEVSAAVFDSLSDITKRRTVIKKQAKPLHFGCAPPGEIYYSVGSTIKPGGADVARSVNVVEQKRVGDFDAAVLQAVDSKSLRDWLVKNGYDIRPTLDPWFETYTQNQWFITAFKIAFNSPIAGKNPLSLTSQAVRISFPTERSFYPYREPAEMQATTVPRELRLFVLGDERVSGKIGNNNEAKPWSASTEWSNKVSPEQMATVVDQSKLPASIGARQWHLTEFHDPSSPRSGIDELYLDTSVDQSPVERTPLVVWEEYDPWPMLFGTIAVLAAVLLGFIVLKKVKVKPKA